MDAKVLSEKLRIVAGIVDVGKRMQMAKIFLREFNWMNDRRIEGILREKVLVRVNDESVFIHGIYYTRSQKFWMDAVKDSLVKG